MDNYTFKNYTFEITNIQLPYTILLVPENKIVQERQAEIRTFKITEIIEWDDRLDFLFLKKLLEFPSSHILNSDYTVCVQNVRVVEYPERWELEINLIEANSYNTVESNLVRETSGGTTTAINEAVTSIDATSEFEQQAGVLTLQINNEDDEYTSFFNNTDYINLYLGYDWFLSYVSQYTIDKLTFDSQKSKDVVQLRGRTRAGADLADVTYTANRTWPTSVTDIYEIITDTAQDLCILKNTDLTLASGEGTALQGKFLSTQRTIEAGTTKAHALKLLADYISTDHNETWIFWADPTTMILHAQSLTSGTADHTVKGSDKLIHLHLSQGTLSKNWVMGYGSSLGSTQESTSLTTLKNDSNYVLKLNSICLPEDDVYIVGSDTGASRAFIGRYSYEYPLTSGSYDEIYYDTTNTTYNCCFAVSTDDIIIGSDTKILHLDIADMSYLSQTGSTHTLSEDYSLISHHPLTIGANVYYIDHDYWDMEYSTDNGANWSTADLTERMTTDDGRMITGTEHSKVYQISDGKVYLWNGSSFIQKLNVGETNYAITGEGDKCCVFYKEAGYVKCYRTSDAGTNWYTSNVGTANTRNISDCCRDGDNVYLVMYESGGLYFRHSGNNGNTWGSEQALAGDMISGPYAAIAANSADVIVVYQTPNYEIKYIYSKDYGSIGNWNTAQTITTHNTNGYTPRVAFSGTLACIAISDFTNFGNYRVSLYVSTDYTSFTEEKYYEGNYQDGNQYSLDGMSADSSYVDWFYHHTAVATGTKTYYHERFTYTGLVDTVQIINNDIIAFAQLGSRYFALTDNAELWYSDNPTTASSWTLVKDFGTNGYDLTADNNYLYVMYDDKVDYKAAPINESNNTFTNLINNSSTEFSCFGKACNVIYAGDQNGSLYSWSDVSHTRTETNTDHGMGTDRLYCIEDCMGDVFVSHGSSNNVRRLYLTYAGSDDDWNAEVTADAIIKDMHYQSQDALILVGNAYIYVTEPETPTDVTYIRKIARDLTKINDDGKEATMFTSDNSTQTALCTQTKSTLDSMTAGQKTGYISVTGDTKYSINELIEIDYGALAGSYTTHRVQHQISDSGWITTIDLGETFMTEASVLLDFVTNMPT